MATWPARFSGRIEYEVGDFADRGLDFALDEKLLGRGGPVVMRGRIEHRGTQIELEVVYPDSFPFLRPEVYARKLRLGRHHNRYDGNLCLLDRSTRSWDTRWTGARLIAERVPYLVDLIQQGGEALRRAEVPQGEPASAFFIHEPGTAIFVPVELLQLPKRLKYGHGRLTFARQEPPQVAIRALFARAEERVRKGKWREIARAGAALASRFSGGGKIDFSWVRLEELPDGREPADMLAAIGEAAAGASTQRWNRVANGHISVKGCVFEEEVRQGEYEDTWLFVIEFRAQGREGAYIVRAERLSSDDLGARIPALAALRERTVALAGLGALGSPLALELSRAQIGNLKVLDMDVLEAGNIVRWAVGLRAVGFPKTNVIAGTIVGDYPFTDVQATQLHIGRAALENRVTEPELDVLERFIQDADLLIDATAEIGIGQLLAYLAGNLDVPQLYVWATEGALGGGVARVVPGRTGCWFCLRLQLEEGAISIPPREETGTVQPRGCASPTFTGANFDLIPIVAQAARMAAELLADTTKANEDVAIMALGDEDGRLTAPRWKCFELSRHPECPVCGAHAA